MSKFPYKPVHMFAHYTIGMEITRIVNTDMPE